MVLCMIPVSFAAGTTTIQGEKYNLAVWSWQNGLQGPLGNENSASSVTAKYNYEDEKADITGQFSENKAWGFAGIWGDFGRVATEKSTLPVATRVEECINANTYSFK